MDGLGCGEVGYGAGDLEDAVEGEDAEVDVGHGGSQNLPHVRIQPANLMKDLSAQIDVAVSTGPFPVAPLLDPEGVYNTLLDGGGGIVFSIWDQTGMAAQHCGLLSCLRIHTQYNLRRA